MLLDTRRRVPEAVPLLKEAVALTVRPCSIGYFGLSISHLTFQISESPEMDQALKQEYIDDTVSMLWDVLFSHQAYYAIVRGKQPGITRTTW